MVKTVRPSWFVQAAVALCQAELLTGLTSGSDRFEEWLLLQREHLHILAQGFNYFSFVIWRSLLNAPTLSDLLDQWLRILSGQQLAKIPPGLDAQLSLLFDYLRTQRCLLILDNAESIMQGGERAGSYRNGYENYGQLLLRIGQTSHQSLLITSREQPREIVRLAAETPLVRTLPLAGLDAVVGEELLGAHGLRGPGVSTATLVEHYSGNPIHRHEHHRCNGHQRSAEGGAAGIGCGGNDRMKGWQDHPCHPFILSALPINQRQE